MHDEGAELPLLSVDELSASAVIARALSDDEKSASDKERTFFLQAGDEDDHR